MKSIYQNPIKNYKKIYPNQNIYQSNNVAMSEIQYNTGNVRLNIVDQLSGEPLSNATITVYATEGQLKDVPIVHVMSIPNPIGVVLPVTCPFGTQIPGPEYSFSAYNIRVDVFGYFANVVYNVRLFPNTTVDFRIEMIPITQVETAPVIEKRLEIPPHPRDILINS